MSISKKNILEELSVMEDDEIFYKTYYQAGSTPSGLKKFPPVRLNFSIIKEILGAQI